jgi:hypothetical protein
MAKPLVLSFNGNETAFEMERLDRRNLYGYVEQIALDEDGNRCKVARLAADGKTLLSTGDAAIGYLSPDGLWRDKGELKPIDAEGREMETVPSSLSAPVALDQTADIDTLLSHAIRTVYQLQSESLDDGLLEKLKTGTVFTFPFSYRGGIEPDVAVLLQGADGDIFMLLGQPADINFVGLQEVGAAVEQEDEEGDGADDDLDFGLM